MAGCNDCSDNTVCPLFLLMQLFTASVVVVYDSDTSDHTDVEPITTQSDRNKPDAGQQQEGYHYLQLVPV